MCFPAVDAAPIVADVVVVAAPTTTPSVIVKKTSKPRHTTYLGHVSRPIVSYISTASTTPTAATISPTSTTTPSILSTASSIIGSNSTTNDKFVIVAPSSSLVTLANQDAANPAFATSIVKLDPESPTSQQETTSSSIGYYQISDLVTETLTKNNNQVVSWKSENSSSSSCSNDEFTGQMIDEDPSIEKIDQMLDDMINVLSNSVGPIIDVNNYNFTEVDSNTNNFLVDDEQFNYASANTLPITNATSSAAASSTFELDLNVFDLMTTDSYLNLEA